MATAAAPEVEAPPPASNDPVVVFDDVSIAFDQNEVLEHISFKVMPGESRIVLGAGRMREERSAEAGQWFAAAGLRAHLRFRATRSM